MGARRLADAAYWSTRIGRHRAAGIADRQARLLGALQYDLVSGDRRAAAARLRSLAPTYDQLRVALGEEAGGTVWR